MRFLITGGAGFIGSHLSEHLLALGHYVTIIDDLSTGSIANIAPFKTHSRFVYHIDTMFKQRLLAELVDEADAVFHLAAAVGVRLIVESPVRTIETNVRATELLLELAAKKKKKILLASTSEVYGKSSKIPFQEDDDSVLGPSSRARWSYACSKLIDEFLALGYLREKGLPVVIVRLFNTVGPRQTGMYGMVIPRFVQQALKGQPITVYGDGHQSRCFGYVGDVVDALAKLMELPAAVGCVFNIGSDEEVSILELAQVVKEVTGSTSPIEFVPYERAYAEGFEDMMRRVPDLSRIREAVGYRSSKTLREIIQAVAASFTAPETGLAQADHAAAAATTIPL